MAPREISSETYRVLIRQLDDLVAIFENHPDEATREQAVALLSGLDMLHHEALGRLVAVLRNHGGAQLLDRALQDPVVHTLLALYGLTELDLPEEAPAPGVAFVPLVQLTVNGRPPVAWTEVARTDEVPPGSMHGVMVEDIPVLLVNIEGEVYGFRNACPGSYLPLDAGRLRGDELICPAHGCRFDARTGRRRDDGEGRLTVLPVAVRGDRIRLSRGNAPAEDSEDANTSNKEVA